MQITIRRPDQRWRPAAACLTLATTLFFSACGDDPTTNAAPERLIPAVEAVPARHGSLPLTQRLSGVVRARNRVEVYPEISAVVTEVLVADGDAVRRGDPLVRLRDTEFEKRLTQARASLRIAEAQLKGARARAREAQADHERMKELADQGLASAAEAESAAAQAESAVAEVDLAEARIEQAEATIGEQQENLSQTVLRSPIDGFVGNRDAELGMLAGPGTRLFVLGQLDSVRVEVVLTDRMLAYIESGMRAEVLLGDERLSAPLSRISPFLNPVAHSTTAEIDLANPHGLLKPGMFVTVDVFHGESEQATLVPLSAIYEDPATGRVGVYMASEDLSGEPIHDVGGTGPGYLTEPIAFDFVPVEVLAEGRMEAAVRPLDAGRWVVTLGQNLLGAQGVRARVRPVDWSRVERLQNLQREDLMRELIEQQEGRREDH